MKIITPLLSLIMITAIIPLNAREMDISTLTIHAELVSVEKGQAVTLMEKFADKPSQDAWNTLQSLIKNGKAEVISLPSITTKSGQRATSEGSTKLKIEATVSPDHTLIDVRFSIDYRGCCLHSNTTLSNSEKSFVGSFDPPPTHNDRSILVFIQCAIIHNSRVMADEKSTRSATGIKINAEAEFFAVPKNQAAALIDAFTTPPMDNAWNLLQNLSKTGKATAVGASSIIADNRRHTLSAEAARWEIEPILSTDAKTIDMNSSIIYKGSQLVQSFEIPNGGRIFAGSFEVDSYPNDTLLIFVKTASKAP